MARRTGVARPVRTTEYELKRGARIWFTVDDDDRLVQVLAVHTHHPNQTK